MNVFLRSLSISIFAAGLLAACAHSPPKEPATPPPGDEPGDSSGAIPTEDETVSSLRVPKIISVMPSAGVVDLGPVLIRSNVARSPEYMQALVIAADELDADAFLADSKRLRDSYRVRPLMGKDLMDPTTKPVSADDLIYHGPYAASGSPTPEKEYFYHALKFISGSPPPCEFPERLVPQPLRPLNELASLEEQFALLNGAFAEGLLASSTFRELRLHCVQQLRNFVPES